MIRRIREVIESIVFAGMQPGGPAIQSQRMRWLGPLRKPIERLLSGGPAPSDPLYLTNRTLWQKMKFGLVLGVPCLIVVSALVLNNYFVKKAPDAKPSLTPAEIASRMLPNLDRVQVETNRDVDVMEVHIDRNKGTAVTGTIMNNTSHQIHNTEIVFDLTDATGSQLGGVVQRIENLPPKLRQSFRLPVAQTAASFALVREIKTR